MMRRKVGLAVQARARSAGESRRRKICLRTSSDAAAGEHGLI
jgi:hypothetical protein